MLTEIDEESFSTCNSSSINAFKVIFRVLNHVDDRENFELLLIYVTSTYGEHTVGLRPRIITDHCTTFQVTSI